MIAPWRLKPWWHGHARPVLMDLRVAVPVAVAVLLAASPWRRLTAQDADGVALRAALSADTVYVGQQVTYTLTVQIPATVRQRLRRNPEFVPPEPRGMLAYDLPLSRQGEPGGAREVHTFRRALFVLTPGRYALGPARLTYSLPQSASFFSREDDRTLRAEGVSFVAIEPPLSGRPQGWQGAVGAWRASLRAEPTTSRVGDPFVLTLRLSGTGNATLLPRPPLSIGWADVVPQDERVVLDSTPALFGGSKEFTWLVTPREDGPRTVPAVAYPTFNPARRAYEIVRTEPLAVSVRPGARIALPSRTVEDDRRTPPEIAAALAGPRRLTLPWPWLWAWAALLAPLPYLAVGLARRRRRGRPVEPEATAPRSARALLERGLATRTGLAVADYTAPGALAAALRLEGVTPETSAAVEALRDECDAQAFDRSRGSGGHAAVTGSDGVVTRTKALLAKVDAEARRVVVALLVALGLAGCVPVTERAETLQAFTTGRTAYAGQDYRRAQQAFRAATESSPRDPVAWESLGSAAWMAADTATAVWAWQRALRLDPTRALPREQLARVPAPQHRGAARVWPVPPLPLLALGTSLWCLGWVLAAQAKRRGRRARWALALAAAGGVAIATGAALDRTLAARDLVVLADATPLRALPALGADPGAMPVAGEVARIVERRGVWLRLELDGDRSGWYPAERARPLTRD